MLLYIVLPNSFVRSTFITALVTLKPDYAVSPAASVATVSVHLFASSFSELFRSSAPSSMDSWWGRSFSVSVAELVLVSPAVPPQRSLKADFLEAAHRDSEEASYLRRSWQRSGEGDFFLGIGYQEGGGWVGEWWRGGWGKWGWSGWPSTAERCMWYLGYSAWESCQKLDTATSILEYKR